VCRNIRTLFNFEPVAKDEEIEAAATQYVRKVSGYTKPSKVNEEAFARAIDAISVVTRELMGELVTTSPPPKTVRSRPKRRESGIASGLRKRVDVKRICNRKQGV